MAPAALNPHEKEERFFRVTELIEAGMSARQACKQVGLPAANFIRYRERYEETGSFDAKYENCGRKPAAKLNPDEIQLVQQQIIQTGSRTLAFRRLARSETCRPEVADVILKKRASKHSIPRSLKQQVEVAQIVMDHHKSPKQTKLNYARTQRKLSYWNGLQDVDLRVGDLNERDDMSNNFVGWIESPHGTDPCSQRYGVRPFRGQNLIQMDVRSLYIPSFSYLVRDKDSYRAEDIRQWVGHTYVDQYVPAIGERWERGIWQSNVLLDSIAALGKQIIVSQRATSKTIEGRFNFFQTLCSDIPGQIGRHRGEMEKNGKLWMECQQGRRDPRDHFLHHRQLTELIAQRVAEYNHEPVEGCIYSGIPAEIYHQGLADRDDLAPLSKEDSWLFASDHMETTASGGEVITRPCYEDGVRYKLAFHSLELLKPWAEGYKMNVYFDAFQPQRGAIAIPQRPLRVGESQLPRIVCEYREPIAQFSTTRTRNASQEKAIQDEKKKNRMVHTEYRSIGLTGKNVSRSKVTDGKPPEMEEIQPVVQPKRSIAPITPDRLAALQAKFEEQYL